MSRLPLIFCLWIFLGSWLLSPPARGQISESVHMEGVSVNVLPALQGDSIHGYLEHRFSIHNTSQEWRQVTVRIPHPNNSFSPYGDHYLADLSRSMAVAPGSSVEMSLFQPALRMGGSDAAVYIDGRLLENPLPIAYHPSSNRHYYGGGGRKTDTTLLASKKISGQFQVEEHRYHYGGSPPPPTAQFDPNTFLLPSHFYLARSNSAVTSWGRHWLSYSRYDGIILTAEEFDAMPAPVGEAVRRYVECGGVLVILGLSEIPTEWVDGRIDQAGLEVYHAGFGLCIAMPGDDVSCLSEQQRLYLRGHFENGAHPWGEFSRFSRGNANRDFPVTADVRLPIRGLFMVVLVFTILLGPVNFIVLKRKNKRIWIFWTLPAISFVACFMIFSYALLVTGWKSYTHVATVTILDENTERATTVGWVGFYSTTTPGDGLQFGYETELTPLGFRGRTSTACNMEWSSGQHLSSGWIAAQVPVHFAVRKSESAKQRLTFRKSGEALSVRNDLGKDIDTLVVADLDGKVYQAESIPAGSSVALSVTRHRPGGKDLRTVYSNLNRVSTIKELTRKPSDYLFPGSYVAIGEESVFLEEGLANLTSRESLALTFGIMKGAIDED